MQSTSVFPDITKYPHSRRINADISTSQGVCHVIYIAFGFSLGKV